MEQHGDAATGITSALSTKLLQTVHCHRRRALHHCGDPDRFQTTGKTSVGSLSRPAQIGIGSYACTVFSIRRKILGLRPTDQSCHHETWLHLDFVDWRSTLSHHEEPDRRILLKERPAPPYQGAQKRIISDILSDHSLSSLTCNHLYVYVNLMRKFVHPHEPDDL